MGRVDRVKQGEKGVQEGERGTSRREKSGCGGGVRSGIKAGTKKRGVQDKGGVCRTRRGGGGSGAAGLTLVSAAGPGGFVDAGAPQQGSTRRLQGVHPAAPRPAPAPAPLRPRRKLSCGASADRVRGRGPYANQVA